MTDIRDISLQLSAQREQKADQAPEYRAEIVEMRNSAGQDSVEVENRPLYVWVRLWAAQGNVVPAFNDKVASIAGLPVIVQSRPLPRDELEITRIDTEIWNMVDDPNTGVVNPLHAGAHEWPDAGPGIDPVTVYPRAWSQLKTYAQNPLSLLVDVSPLRYYIGSALINFGGGTVDLTAAVGALAAGQARLVLVYLATATNTLGTTNGAVGADAGGWFLPEPATTILTYPSAVIRIYGGQTEIDEDDIRDRRMFLNDAIADAVTGSGVANQVAYWTAVGAIGGDAGFTYDPATNQITAIEKITFTGATTVNEITVPDNIADALGLLDAGGLEYLRIISTDANPYLSLFPASDNFVGIGIAVPTGHLHIYDITVNTVAAYYGIRNEHIKTLGATDHDDWLSGVWSDLGYNQAAGEIGNVQVSYNRYTQTDGNVGDVVNSRDVRGIVSEIVLDGGKVWGVVYGIRCIIDIDAAADTTSSVFGAYIQVDDDAGVGGTVYMLYLAEQTGIDYGIYQSGTALNYLGGWLGVQTIPGSQLHVVEPTVDLHATFQSVLGDARVNIISDDGAGDEPIIVFYRGTHVDANRKWNISVSATTDDLVFYDYGYGIVATFQEGGNVGVGVPLPLGKLHVDQASVSGNTPVLILDQADLSEEMIEFVTTIGVGNPIEAIGGKTLTTTHFVRVTVPGGLARYFPVGTIA